ncbi:uncharacterized protein V6R79_018646 [Siganus canaliculatus]
MVVDSGLASHPDELFGSCSVAEQSRGDAIGRRADWLRRRQLAPGRTINRFSSITCSLLCYLNPLYGKQQSLTLGFAPVDVDCDVRVVLSRGAIKRRVHPALSWHVYTDRSASHRQCNSHRVFPIEPNTLMSYEWNEPSQGSESARTAMIFTVVERLHVTDVDSRFVNENNDSFQPQCF